MGSEVGAAYVGLARVKKSRAGAWRSRAELATSAKDFAEDTMRSIACALALLACAEALMLTPGVAPRPVAAAALRAPPALAMAAIDAKTVKKLRDATGAGMMDCKKALVEFDGDMEQAMEELRKKGLASADKKASRAAKEGIIETYIHTGAKLGIMVEVNCETDFVAKRPEFQELAKALAMQLAACPTVEYVSEADVDPAWIEREKAIEAGAEDLQGKPENIIEKIVTGRVAKSVNTKLLMVQPYIRDPDMDVEELVKTYVGKLGENIKVARFARFNMGETQGAGEE